MSKESEAEAQRLLKEIQEIKVKAEEHLKAAEIAKQKADSEALYASNAKGYCEEHSKTISNLKGGVEADVKAIGASVENAKNLAATLTTNKAAIDEDITKIREHRATIEKTVTDMVDVAKKGTDQLSKINADKATSEASIKEIDEAKRVAMATRSNIEASKKDIDAHLSSAQTSVTAIAGHKTKSEQDAENIKKLLDESQTDRTSLDEILKQLENSNNTAGQYEKQLQGLLQEADELRGKIEKLLPGATSAGLASSFEDQKTRSSKPQRRWFWTFIVCMIGLAAISGPSFLAALDPSKIASWDVALRALVMRLPIAAPLIWLAIYAGHNYMLSLRLEEEYAYKEALSRAFEGYKREMEKIAIGGDHGPAPLAKLCSNILAVLAERPGRIYDGKHQNMTPMGEANNAIKKAVNFADKQIAKE